MFLSNDCYFFHQFFIFLFGLLQPERSLVGKRLDIESFLFQQLQLLFQLHHLLLHDSKLSLHFYQNLFLRLQGGDFLIFQFEQLISFRYLSFAFELERIQFYCFDFERALKRIYFDYFCIEFCHLSFHGLDGVYFLFHLLLVLLKVKGGKIVVEGVIILLQFLKPFAFLFQKLVFDGNLILYLRKVFFELADFNLALAQKLVQLGEFCFFG